MGFATKWKTKKIWAKEWSKKHIFLSHFFIFHHKPKRMLKFLRNGFWIVIVQKIRKKRLSHSGKMHISVSGHVTLGVVQWRHELDYICPLWVLSKFGPIEAYMCRVIASWFFPSNRIKRYFNGPLREMSVSGPLWQYHTSSAFYKTSPPCISIFFNVLTWQKRLGHKENSTKYRRLSWKPQSHVRILIYQTWPINHVEFRKYTKFHKSLLQWS